MPGKAIINKKGDIKGYGTVRFHPGGISNILSLSNIQKKCKVTYNSTLNEGFLVHKADGTTQVFGPSKKGLFVSDVQDNAGHVFVNTDAKNKSKYTIKEYSDAVCVHSLQDIIGCPTTADFIKYIEDNMIPNCPITKGDILCAEGIFGKDIRSLHGKTTRRKMHHVVTTIADQPTGMLGSHGIVTMEANIMYINEVPFIVTTSAELNEKAATIATSLKQVIQMYQRRGFEVQHILCDGKFEHIKKYFACRYKYKHG